MNKRTKIVFAMTVVVTAVFILIGLLVTASMNEQSNITVPTNAVQLISTTPIKHDEVINEDNDTLEEDTTTEEATIDSTESSEEDLDTTEDVVTEEI